MSRQRVPMVEAGGLEHTLLMVGGASLLDFGLISQRRLQLFGDNYVARLRTAYDVAERYFNPEWF